MKNVSLAILVLFLFSCVAKRISYDPDFTITNENAKLMMEQVLAEQPAQYAPASSIISEDYLELNFGLKTYLHGNSGGVIIIDGLFIGSG